MDQLRKSSWIVSPAFDLLFFANVAWVLALIPGFALADAPGTHIDFWQVYFITTPHRWITLGLVAFDPDRREGRTGWFLGLAILAAVVVAGVWVSTGVFFCLALIDFCWNAWHFASQHHGVLRVYGRKVGGGWPNLERYGLRVFIVYAIIRVPVWTTSWLDGYPDDLAAWLPFVDLGMLLLAAVVLASAWRDRTPGSLPKLTYLTSVCCLYSAVLIALNLRASLLVIALAAAFSAFHAIEYLAIVTHYAWRREDTGSAGLFQMMARRWLLVLAAYVVILGLSAALIERHFGELWLGLNLWAAFLHYAYDGMIWKLRRPATAQALGIEGGDQGKRARTLPSRVTSTAVKEVTT